MKLSLLMAMLGLSVLAEAPKLEALFPAGGQVGSTFAVTASGKIDADVHLWTDAPGVFFVPNGKKREWQATLTERAVPGVWLVHAANAEGASEARWFSVGTLLEAAEVEPNDVVGKGQPVEKLPRCVNARLDKSGDVDGYRVTLTAGQTLVGRIEAYSLGSGVDMLAHVLDDQGVRLLTGSDARNPDPFIVFQAPKTGTYTVQVAGFAHPPTADVRFLGGQTVVYRLHLTTGPTVLQVFPAAAAQQGKTEVGLVGVNLDPQKRTHTVEATAVRRAGDLGWIMPAGALAPLQVLMTPKPAGIEKEPNNTKETATEIQVGAFGGRISDPSDIDRYAIAVKKGDKLQARVVSKRLGLPLDAMLKIEGPDGKVITTVDDQSDQMPDPQVAWTAAADGLHHLLVEDLFHQGGADKAYVLEVAPLVPTYEANLTDAKPLKLAAGKTASVKLNVKLLHGFQEALVVRASGLPAGVYAPDVRVPAKGGEVEIKLHAATNAEPTGKVMQLVVWTTAEPAQAEAVRGPLRGESLRGTSLLDSTSDVWLTVTP